MEVILSEPLTYTVDETAKLLNTGRTATYEAIHRGEIPAIRIGRFFRVPRVALMRILEFAGAKQVEAVE